MERMLKLFEDEKIVDELEVPGSFCVVRSIRGGVDCWDPYMQIMRYSDKFVLRQEYQKRAQELVREYGERLMYVYPSRIAFIVDESWELKENTTPNSRVKVDIVRATKFSAFGDRYSYIIHLKNYYLEKWSDAQINAAIMSQLLRINNPDGCILKSQDDAANPLVATFGAGYLEPGTVIPDLLKEHVHIKEFRRADGQMTFEELEPATAVAEAEDPAEAEETCGMCAHWKEDYDDMGACTALRVNGLIAPSRPACCNFDAGYPTPADDEDGDDHDDAA